MSETVNRILGDCAAISCVILAGWGLISAVDFLLGHIERKIRERRARQ